MAKKFSTALRVAQAYMKRKACPECGGTCGEAPHPGMVEQEGHTNHQKAPIDDYLVEWRHNKVQKKNDEDSSEAESELPGTGGTDEVLVLVQP